MSVCVCVCVCACVSVWVFVAVCVRSEISTTRQVHGKLLASTTDKTTSGTRMAELMGGEIQKKEGEGEKTA